MAAGLGAGFTSQGPQVLERIAVSGLNKGTSGGGITTLYRAVSEAEFQQLTQPEAKFVAGPSLSGKFFAESAADAAKWGELLHGAGNFRIISAEFPTSMANQFMRWERLDAIWPARYGELDQLTEVIIRSVT